MKAEHGVPEAFIPVPENTPEYPVTGGDVRPPPYAFETGQMNLTT